MARKYESTPKLQPEFEVDKEAEDFYPNPFPALPVFNNPVFSKELEDSVKQEHSLPLDTWHTHVSARTPAASKLGPVFSSRREAWKATGWVHCKDFLGQGGFGKVFLGFQYEDRHSNTPLISRKLCAIKEVVIKYGTIEEMDPGIAMEAYVLHAASHPNVVRLFACYCIPSRNRFYFVMEYADGKDLSNELCLTGFATKAMPLPEAYGRSLFIGMVEGIAYLHSRGVAHRDIKPDNVLIKISADGQRKIPKIADFGLSMIYVGQKNADGTRQQFTAKGACGTRSYMAPELHCIMKTLSVHDFNAMQCNPKYWDRPIPVCNMDFKRKLEDERNADNGKNRRGMCEITKEFRHHFYRPPQIDIYSLGVTLHMMLAGELPYDLHAENALVYMFRCEPMRCKWRLKQPTFDFICQMLEPSPGKRLTIQQIRDHEWMKGPVAGPSTVTRDLPEDKFGVYVSPTPSPGPSTARPDDSDSKNFLDDMKFNPLDIDGSGWDKLMKQMRVSSGQQRPASPSQTTGSEWDDKSGFSIKKSPLKKASGSTWDESSGLLAGIIQRPRPAATGRGQVPQKMGALLNAFGNLAVHPGPGEGRQRSMSLGAQGAAAAAPLTRVRSSSLNEPAQSRVRQASADGAAAKKPILSSLKDMASRVASKVAGVKSAPGSAAPSPAVQFRAGSDVSSSSSGSSGRRKKKKKAKGRRSN